LAGTMVTKNVNAHATSEKYLVARKKQWITDSARSNYLERKGIGGGWKGSMSLFRRNKTLGSRMLGRGPT
jgi:hypothetical protein